jgi:hypothetical protein
MPLLNRTANMEKPVESFDLKPHLVLVNSDGPYNPFFLIFLG